MGAHAFQSGRMTSFYDKMKEAEKVPEGYIKNPDGRLEPDWGLIKAKQRAQLSAYSDEFWKKNFHDNVIKTNNQ